MANPLSDIAMETLPVSHMLLIEVGVGFGVISLVAVARLRRLRFSWRWAALLGILEPGLTYIFGNIGYASGTVTVGLIIMSSETLILALLARALLKEHINNNEAIAIAAGFAGALLVGWSGVTTGGTAWGSLAFLLAACAAAGYAIAIRIYSMRQPTFDSFALTWAQTLVSMIIAIAIYVVGEPLNIGSTQAVWAAAGAGIFGVAIPFLLFSKAASHIPARHAAIALNIIPVVGISIGALLGRGYPTLWQYAGGALVIASLMVLARREH
jgi:drug/metabolite transporter (DMT)-like permease